MTNVLILAAGQSSRLGGRDKLMEVVDGKPLLRHQIDRAMGIGPIYVALPSADHPRKAALIGTQATPLICPSAAEGMGGTMRDAMRLLPAGDVMMLLADLIDIKNSDLKDVLNSKVTHPDNLIWRGATPVGHAGHPILFDSTVRPAFANLSGDTGGEEIVKPLKPKTYLVKFDDDRARRDLDTPQDWAQWRADRASRVSNSFP